MVVLCLAGTWVVVEMCFLCTAFPISPCPALPDPHPRVSVSSYLISLALCFREQELGLSPLLPSSWFLMQIGLTTPQTVLHVKAAGHVIRNAVPKPSPSLQWPEHASGM